MWCLIFHSKTSKRILLQIALLANLHTYQKRCSPRTRHSRAPVLLVQLVLCFCSVFLSEANDCVLGSKLLHLHWRLHIKHHSIPARKMRPQDGAGLGGFQRSWPVLKLPLELDWAHPVLLRARLPPTPSSTPSTQHCSGRAQGWWAKCLSQFKQGKGHYSILLCPPRQRLKYEHKSCQVSYRRKTCN